MVMSDCFSTISFDVNILSLPTKPVSTTMVPLFPENVMMRDSWVPPQPTSIEASLWPGNSTDIFACVGLPWVSESA